MASSYRDSSISRFPRAPGMVENNVTNVQPNLTLQSLDAKFQEMRDMIEDLSKQVSLLATEVRMQRRTRNPSFDLPITHDAIRDHDNPRHATLNASSKLRRRGHSKYESPEKTISPPIRAPTDSTKVPKSRRRFDDLGIPLSVVLDVLLMRNLLTPLPPPVDSSATKKHPHRYCSYHQMVGHDTDFCGALRSEVQDLIDAGIIPKPSVTKESYQQI